MKYRLLLLFFTLIISCVSNKKNIHDSVNEVKLKQLINDDIQEENLPAMNLPKGEEIGRLYGILNSNNLSKIDSIIVDSLRMNFIEGEKHLINLDFEDYNMEILRSELNETKLKLVRKRKNP